MEIANNKLREITERFNDRQQAAVFNLRGPQLIVAGAGSGKTSVLTARIALLVEQGIVPERILALTFTRKAANEMRSRIKGIVGEDAIRLKMGTFHSVFAGILRQYAEYIGFHRNYTILDEDDSLSLLKKIIKERLKKEVGKDEAEWNDKEKKAFKIKFKEYTDECSRRISWAKNELIPASIYCTTPELKKRDAWKRVPLVGEIYKDYTDTCFRNGVMDFDDILLYMDMLLFNNPGIREELESHFDYIMIDEFQDTNTAQYSIIRRLTRKNKNICVVGDDSQSIYAFRGAKISNIIGFRNDYQGCGVVLLEQNYRSTKSIVDSANRLIGFNTNRIEKKCFSGGDEGCPIEFIEADTDRSEAKYIIQTIIEKHKSGDCKWGDFAVLYRTNSQSRELEDCCLRMGVPYMVYSGTSFFKRKEIKDHLAYFKLAVNPNDDESVQRVINLPVRGVGDTAFSLILAYARARHISVWNAISEEKIGEIGLKPKARAGVEEFRTLIRNFSIMAIQDNAYENAKKMVEQIGLLKEYKESDDSQSLERADNVRELLDSVKGYEMETKEVNQHIEDDLPGDASLTGFLQNIMLLTSVDNNSEAEDKVNLMTAHCAKGLEFKTVFVAGMEQGLFPIDREEESRFRQERIEEERRLFYVAVTRAEKELYLTMANRRIRYGKSEPTKISQFVTELLGELEYENDMD